MVVEFFGAAADFGFEGVLLIVGCFGLGFLFIANERFFKSLLEGGSDVLVAFGVDFGLEHLLLFLLDFCVDPILFDFSLAIQGIEMVVLIFIGFRILGN